MSNISEPKPKDTVYTDTSQKKSGNGYNITNKICSICSDIIPDVYADHICSSCSRTCSWRQLGNCIEC